MANKAYQKNILNETGESVIDLNSGVMVFQREDTKGCGDVLPFSLAHIYKSNAVSDNICYETMSVPSCCGKGWRLNVQQYLIKKPIVNLDGKVADRYVYIDGAGETHTFEEIYYYMNGITKTYLPENSITIDINSNLIYENGATIYEVKTEHKNTDGYKLGARMDSFIDLHFVEQRSQQIYRLEDEIENIKAQITDVDNGLANISNSKNILLLTKKYQIEQNEVQNQENSISRSLVNFEKNTAWRRTKIMDAAYNEINNANYLQRLQAEQAIAQVNFDNTISNYKNQLVTYVGNLITSSTDLNTNQNAVQDNLYTTEEIKLGKLKTKLETEKTRRERELYRQKAQTPVHYIVTESDIILGFAPMQDAGDGKNYFRLVNIFDSYENVVAINYDKNKIVEIADTDGCSISFKYKANLLTSIVDTMGKKTEYGYSGTTLRSINACDRINSYVYNSAGKLTEAYSSLGESLHFSISGEKHLSVEYKTNVLSLSEEAITRVANGGRNSIGKMTMTYHDMSTIVCDEKGHKTTYVFDSDGRTNTVYEKNFSEIVAASESVDGAKIIRHEYKSPKQRYSVAIHPNAYIYASADGINIDGNSTVVQGKQTISDHNVGETCAIGDVILTNYQLNENNVMVLTAKTNAPNIALYRTIFSAGSTVLNGIKYVALSGWAKADSVAIDNEHDKLLHYSGYSLPCFDLRLFISYTDGSSDNFCRSFDYKNKGWQYCSVPVILNTTKTISYMDIKLDYSKNNGAVQFSDLKVKDAEWKREHYNEKELLIRSDSTDGKTTEYIYDEEDRLLKSIANKGTLSRTTKYEYNSYGKLVKMYELNDTNFAVENQYDEKGRLQRVLKYNRHESGLKFVQERELNENGKESKSLNDFGEMVTENKYLSGTNIVSEQTDSKGRKISCGYSSEYDYALTNICANEDGAHNGNMFVYRNGKVVRVVHNETDFKYSYDGYGEITQTMIAGQSVLNNKYDRENNIVTEKNALGESFNTQSDGDGNVLSVKKTVNNVETTLITNSYDGDNQLINEHDHANGESREYEFDKKGRNTKTTVKKDGAIKTTFTTIYTGDKAVVAKYANVDRTSTETFFYDNTLLGRINKTNISDYGDVTLMYDRQNRLLRINRIDVLRTKFNYLTKGERSSNLVSSIWYESMYRTKENLRYMYDEKGNITDVKENGELVERYAYDGLNRLVRENNKRLNKTVLYSYDSGGNICNKLEYTYTLEEEPTSVAQNSAYIYSFTKWRDQLMNYNGEEFVYDKIGNPTKYRNKVLKFSNGKRLDSYDNDRVQYEYNSFGQRTSKSSRVNSTVPYTTTTYCWDGGRLLHEKHHDGKVIGYIYDITGLAGFVYNGTKYTYRKNVAGDITHIYKNDSTIVAKYTYDAWGKYTINADVDGIATLNPFRYRGYYFDTETGLYWVQSRYYDPEIGRWINADDVAYLDPETIGGLNLYSYCGNNPVMNIDTDGHAFFSILLLGFLMGALIGGITGTISGIVTGKTGSDLVGHIAGGAVLGGVLGAATFLGGALGAGALAATAGNILGGLAVASVGAFGAGVLNYGLQEVWTVDNATWDWSKALAHGGIAAVQGLTSFGIGAAMGGAGMWKSLKPGNGFMSTIKGSVQNVIDLASKMSFKTVLTSVTKCSIYYLKNNIGQIVGRAAYKSLFVMPWGLIRWAI